MAAINIPSLIYQPVGPNSTKWAAQVALTADNVYTVNLQNAQGRDDLPIHLHFATIDNVGNATVVPVRLGTYSFSVPPFTRETFELPEGLTNLGLTISTGNVTLTVSEDRLASDQTNSLAVQQTAAATLTYQFIVYSADQVQLTTDVNKSILFQPTVANMTYQLMLGSSAGNGWLEFLHNEGTKIVTVAVTAPNTINGVAANFLLFPGQSAVLSSDGNNWHVAEAVYSGLRLVAFATFSGLTGAIFNSGGLVSVARLGTGSYRLNFAVPMPDTNYTLLATTSFASASGDHVFIEQSTSLVGSVELIVVRPGPFGIDPDRINALVYR